MKKGEPEITADDADAMLKKDALNRLSKLNKGGLLTTVDRRRLKRVIARSKTPPQVKRREVTSADPKTFEGTYHQRIRRRNVFRLRMMNKTIAEIETELRIGDKTVISDLRAIDAALHKTIDKAQADAILNERLSNLESLRDIALKGVEASDGNEQIGYLNTLSKLEELITKLLQDAGVLLRAPSRHELAGPDGKPFTMPVGTGQTIVHVHVKRDKSSDAAAKRFGREPAGNR